MSPAHAAKQSAPHFAKAPQTSSNSPLPVPAATSPPARPASPSPFPCAGVGWMGWDGDGYLGGPTPGDARWVPGRSLEALAAPVSSGAQRRNGAHFAAGSARGPCRAVSGGRADQLTPPGLRTPPQRARAPSVSSAAGRASSQRSQSAVSPEKRSRGAGDRERESEPGRGRSHWHSGAPGALAHGRSRCCPPWHWSCWPPGRPGRWRWVNSSPPKKHILTQRGCGGDSRLGEPSPNLAGRRPAHLQPPAQPCPKSPPRGSGSGVPTIGEEKGRGRLILSSDAGTGSSERRETSQWGRKGEEGARGINPKCSHPGSCPRSSSLPFLAFLPGSPWRGAEGFALESRVASPGTPLACALSLCIPSTPFAFPSSAYLSFWSREWGLGSGVARRRLRANFVPACGSLLC